MPLLPILLPCFLLPVVLRWVAGFASAAQQQANIFSEDDRQAQPRNADSPYAAVGALQWIIDGRWAGRGTATLISPCHVLTAYHIAFPSGRSPEDPISFAYGPAEGSEPFGKRVRAFRAIWGDKARHAHEDWALLRLAPCIEEAHPWWPPADLSIEQAMQLANRVMMAGYPTDRPIGQVSVDPSCRVIGYDRRLPTAWLHDCATRIGDSGGALFYLAEDGKPRLLAVVHAEGKRRQEILPIWSPRHSNFAVPVGNFIERIRPFLAEAD